MRQVFLHRRPHSPRITTTSEKKALARPHPSLARKLNATRTKMRTMSMTVMMSDTLRAEVITMVYGRWVVRAGRGEEKPASFE
ncbi:hypothetical protein PENTCL1PPCAC_876, partial [Pristionchus entomophagus]